MRSKSKLPFGILSVSPHCIPDLLQELRDLLEDKRLGPRTVLCVNAHIYNLAVKNERLRGALEASRITAADGMVIVWAARLMGHRISERCNMTEAFRAFLAAAMPPSNAILVGCSQEEASAAATEAQKITNHCRILAAYSGYLNEREYEEIFSRHAGIDFVFLGMGTPRTEYLAEMAARLLPQAIVWGIGGGTIRIYAGKVKEAPGLWRRMGLQWLHRLLSEPGAMWSRYLIGNPLFIWRVLRGRK